MQQVAGFVLECVAYFELERAAVFTGIRSFAALWQKGDVCDQSEPNRTHPPRLPHEADRGLVEPRAAQAVKHGPGCLVAPKTEYTLQPQSTNALLLVRDISDSGEPHP